MENPKEMANSDRFETCIAHHLKTSPSDAAPVAQIEAPPPPTDELQFRPQTVPKAATGPTVNRHRSNQGYGTPWDLTRACEKHFNRRIVWDLAANESNAKADRWYDEAMNSLVQPWHKLCKHDCDLLWLNPPFDNIAPWAEKCAAEAALGARILLLTPASIGSNWFRDYVFRKAIVSALNGRITFVGASDPYPKDCMISAFGFGVPAFNVWQWGKDVPNA